MTRLNLTLEIQSNNIGTKRVNVRSSLVAANLVAAIKDKFNLDGDFELKVKDSAQALAPESALDQAGVAEGAALVASRRAEATGTLEEIERSERKAFSKAFKRV